MTEIRMSNEFKQFGDFLPLFFADISVIIAAVSDNEPDFRLPLDVNADKVIIRLSAPERIFISTAIRYNINNTPSFQA